MEEKTPQPTEKNGQEDENKAQSVEVDCTERKEDADQNFISNVVITVDTVETPQRSPDEEEPTNAYVPQDNESSNESTTNTTEHEDSETNPIKNEETEVKTDKDIAIKPKASSLDDPSRDDNLEQNSPSSESSKTEDSVVEVFIDKTANVEDNEVEAMDQEEDDEGSSLC